MQVRLRSTTHARPRSHKQIAPPMHPLLAIANVARSAGRAVMPRS